MPVEVAPNRIEVSDFSGGYAPDPEDASLPSNALTDSLNVVLDPGSGALELRKGYTRVANSRKTALKGQYVIQQIMKYAPIISGVPKHYFVCVLTDGSTNANNVQIWVYDFAAGTFSRVDTAGRTWAHSHWEHWHAIIEGTYYGGSYGNVIYSWHPTNGWNADPTTPNVKTWVDGVDGSITPSTQYGRDYAFKKGTTVIYSGKYYSTLKGIRYSTWESGQQYNKGERVSRKATITSQYWRSFECILSHVADTNNRPGDGVGSPATYWKRVRLKNVVDEDAEVTNDWTYMPLPGKGSVGLYHGNRLWVRHDDSDNLSRLQYSAPARPEKGALISDLDWNPKKWAPVDDDNGDGGGWFTVPLEHANHIRALYSYGSYLLIFGRHDTFVLAGTNEQTWTLRKLTSEHGAINSQCVAEHDGLVYFLTDAGNLCRTDGTAVRRADGSDKVREWLKDRIDRMAQNEDGAGFSWHPRLVSYGPYVIMTLPDEDHSTQASTLVYHPDTGSFWLWDLPALGVATHGKLGVDHLYFSTPLTAQTNDTPCLFKYTDDPGNEVWTDDDPTGNASSAATTAISWLVHTAWFSFGSTRNERRIRRAWALVTGAAAQTVSVLCRKNFKTATQIATTRTTTLVGTSTAAEYAESLVGVNDAYAASMKVYGSASANTVLHGVGVDTEPRRTRFHTG